MGFLGDAFDAVADFGSGLIDSIGDSILNAIATAVGKGLYYLIDNGLLSIVQMFYRLFNVFAGVNKVSYDGEKMYLINVFLQNTVINNIYWAMALLGIVLVFVFTIVAVIRKIFDLYDKEQRPLGAILGAAFKSIFTMLILSFAVSAVMTLTNVLLQRVNYIFNNAYEFNQVDEIHYTNQQYATMARVLNTIGNYSLNPSYKSRYNMNACFNEIRGDLYDLQQQGVFSVYYVTYDSDGNQVDTWQSALQGICMAADLRTDLKMDVYNASVSTSIQKVMDILQTNRSFEPLEEYKRAYDTSDDVGIDRILFLVGTMNAALDDGYNVNPSFTDNVRGAFYRGDMSMYSIDDVESAFNIKVGAMSYVLVAILAYMTLKSLWRIILQCAGRIFTLMGLYLIAPPFIATMPMDDGKKFKEWITAFTVQTLGIFGTVIPMRLLIIFLPIVVSDKLVIFPSSPALNLVSKVLLILAALNAAEHFGSIITGILTNNAGWQALGSDRASQQYADALGARAVGAAGGILGGGLRLGAWGIGVAGRAAGLAAKGVGYLGGKAAGLVSGAAGAAGGLAVSGMRGVGNKIFGSSGEKLPGGNGKMGAPDAGKPGLGSDGSSFFGGDSSVNNGGTNIFSSPDGSLPGGHTQMGEGDLGAPSEQGPLGDGKPKTAPDLPKGPSGMPTPGSAPQVPTPQGGIHGAPQGGLHGAPQGGIHGAPQGGLHGAPQGGMPTNNYTSLHQPDTGAFGPSVSPQTTSNQTTFGGTSPLPTSNQTTFGGVTSKTTSSPTSYGGTTSQNTSNQTSFSGTSPLPTSNQTTFGGSSPLPTSNQTTFGGTTPQTTSSPTSYGGTSPLPTSNQTSYGGTTPQTTSSPTSYGGTTPQTTSSPTSYGGSSPLPTSSQTSYGGTSPQPTVSPTAYVDTSPQYTGGQSSYGAQTPSYAPTSPLGGTTQNNTTFVQQGAQTPTNVTNNLGPSGTGSLGNKLQTDGGQSSTVKPKTAPPPKPKIK